MGTHLGGLKKTSFVLWHPNKTQPAPKLVIGRFQAGNPPTLADRRVFDLSPMVGSNDLWSIKAAQCGLANGQVYHYWFEVSDSSPVRDGRRILCTDPTALTVDWRLRAERLDAGEGLANALHFEQNLTRGWTHGDLLCGYLPRWER